jgi:hypothetical protein
MAFLVAGTWVLNLSAQDLASGYTQPSFVKTLRMESPNQAISYPIWVDQTDSLSMTVSSLVKNLSIRLVGPGSVVFTFGQPVLDQFQCSVSPDPQIVPDATGANYLMDLANPIKGQWTLQIQTPATPSSPLSLPMHITFNNQVGPVLFGGGNAPVGKPVSFSLAVMDGIAKVGNLQITATLFRLDDPTISPISITFTDDGQGADYAAGDSIYSVYLTPSQVGSYMLQIEVSGDASTGHFQRSIASGFKIVPKTATITGAFQERVIVGGPK